MIEKRLNASCLDIINKLQHNKVNKLPNSPSNLRMKLTANTIISKYPFITSPELSKLKRQNFQKLSEKSNQAYTEWEILLANKEPKQNSHLKVLKCLRRTFKNPYIYTNNIDVEVHQETIESCLQQIYKSILDD